MRKCNSGKDDMDIKEVPKVQIMMNDMPIQATVVSVQTQDHRIALQRPMNSAEIRICVIHNFQEIVLTLVSADTENLKKAIVRTARRIKK